MRALLLALALAGAFAGCSASCESSYSLVPLARVTYDIAWNEPEARAGFLDAGFEPDELPYDPGSSVYSTDGAITLISRATATGSELTVSYPGQGRLGLTEAEREDAQSAAERDLAPSLAQLLSRFEEGSTWTRAAEPTWDHAVSEDACG